MRVCLCCGTVTETPSIPSCWDHWLLLPEELRSSIIKTSARGQLIQYAKAATEAIAIWRKAGAWQPKGRTPQPNAAAQAHGNVVPFRAMSPGFIDRQVEALRALHRQHHSLGRQWGDVRWGT
jgi:hypothetical protein